MKLKSLALIILSFSLLTPNAVLAADERIYPVVTQNVISTQTENVAPVDLRKQILRAYLAKYKSEMQYSADDFVEAADESELDYKLVAAIAGVESTFGKHVPGGTDPRYSSYNAWGWGVYGTQAIYFKSWKEGIYTVSRGLRKNYVNKGYTDPYSMNKIYAASPTWGSKVTWFLNDMEKFEAQYKRAHSPEAVIKGLSTPTVGVSGDFRVKTTSLAYR
jgi:hypothetical protein